MQYKLAKSAGFCFGVKRAIDIVFKLPKDKKCCTLGPIIHNKEIVNELEQKGIYAINDIDEAKDFDVVVIRSHGVPKNVYDKLSQMGKEIIDATCPFVSKIHKIVADESQKGNVIVIAGDSNHPEVIGIMGHSCNKCYTFKNEEELNDILALIPDEKNTHISLVAQTTFDSSLWQKSVKILQKVYTNLDIFDTICNATSMRQNEADELSKTSDCMIVIGDKKSSNTDKLYMIAKRNCDNTIKIETVKDLDNEYVSKFETIGVTAGASTPDRIIKEVLDKL